MTALERLAAFLVLTLLFAVSQAAAQVATNDQLRSIQNEVRNKPKQFAMLLELTCLKTDMSIEGAKANWNALAAQQAKFKKSEFNSENMSEFKLDEPTEVNSKRSFSGVLGIDGNFFTFFGRSGLNATEFESCSVDTFFEDEDEAAVTVKKHLDLNNERSGAYGTHFQSSLFPNYDFWIFNNSIGTVSIRRLFTQ